MTRKALRVPIPADILRRLTPAVRVNPTAELEKCVRFYLDSSRTHAFARDLWGWCLRYLIQRTHQVHYPKISVEIAHFDRLARNNEKLIQTRHLRVESDLVLIAANKLYEARIRQLRKRKRADGPRKDTPLTSLLPELSILCSAYGLDQEKTLGLVALVLETTGIKDEGATKVAELRKLLWPPVSDEDRPSIEQLAYDLKKRSLL